MQKRISPGEIIQSMIRDLYSYSLKTVNLPLSGGRRIELTFFSDEDETLGQIWLDNEGTCASTFLETRHRVICGAFDFDSWESSFKFN